MNGDLHPQEFERRIHQLGPLANQKFTFQQVAKENKALVRNLKKFSGESAIPLIASLLTIPKYQANCIRLETLVTLAAIHCEGRKVARTIDVCRWHHMLQSSQTVLADDATGDIFVHLVNFEGEAFRLIGGTWNHTDFYVQRILDVVETMPNEEIFSRWKETIRLLLNISDQLCERSGLSRYQGRTAEYFKPILVHDLPSEDSLLSRTTFTLGDFSTTEEVLELLESLTLDEEILTELPKQLVEESILVHAPLLSFKGNNFCITLPARVGDTLREFVLLQCLDHGLADSFDQTLRQIYQWQLSTSKLLNLLEPVQTMPLETQDEQIAYTVVEIDEGHFIAVFSILPSLETLYERVFDPASETDDTIEKAITRTVNEVISDVSSRPEFHRGRVFYITCCWGLDSYLRVPVDSYANWTSCQLSAGDFDRMNYLRDISFTYLWKILDGLETLQAQGIKFLDSLSLLDLVSWAHRHAGQLLPHEQGADSKVSLTEPLELQMSPTSLFEVRQLSYQAHDIHVVRDDSDSPHTLVRADPYDRSHNDIFARLYYSKSDFIEQRKHTVFYEGNMQIWTTLTTTDTISVEFEGHILQQVNTWLARIGNAVDNFTSRSSVEPRIGRVDIELESKHDPAHTLNNPTTDELAEYCRTEYSDSGNSAKIVFKDGFEAGFNASKNVAKQLFGRTLTQAVLQVLRLPIENLSTFEKEIFPNKDPESLHRTVSYQSPHHLETELSPKLIQHSKVQTSSVELGLGSRVQSQSAGAQIIGKTESTAFLNGVVNILLDDIVAKLQHFERRATIKKLLLNIERTEQDKSEIIGTSDSVNGLFQEDLPLCDYSAGDVSRFREVIVVSQTLMEIAICECPLGSGREPANLELSKLMAQVKSFIYHGGMSDAISVNLLEPTISVTPIGQILYRSTLDQNIAQQSLTQLSAEDFLNLIPDQQKQYETSSFVEDAEEYSDPTFPKLWKQDFGYRLELGLSMIETLETLAQSLQIDYFQLTKQEYLKLVKNFGVSKGAAEAFLLQFSMLPRAHWQELPKGFENFDTQPWKFGNKYSYLTRPIVRLTDGESNTSELIVCPAALLRAFIYVIDQATCGRLDRTFFPRPSRWDKWLDDGQQRHPFTKQVTHKLQEAGWNTKVNVKIAELLQTKLEQEYGDIDVIAWKDDKQEVLVVECKDLALVRDIADIASGLSQYQGKTVDGKRDKLKQHHDRMNLLEDHLPMVAKFAQLDQVTIKSCLIFSRVNPMFYATIPALKGTFVGRIDDLIHEFS